MYLTFSLLWMVVIFLLSQQNGEVSGNLSSSLTYHLLSFVVPSFSKLSSATQMSMLETCHFIIRKLAHMSEYALLWMLWFQYFKSSGKNVKQCFLYALLICFVYSCSDEWHQSFIPDRGPSFRDVLIDSSGALCCSIGYFFIQKEVR